MNELKTWYEKKLKDCIGMRPFDELDESDLSSLRNTLSFQGYVLSLRAGDFRRLILSELGVKLPSKPTQ